jgi:hypothetical protein
LIGLSLVTLPKQASNDSSDFAESFVAIYEFEVIFSYFFNYLQFLVICGKIAEKHQYHNGKAVDVCSVIVFL